MSSRHTDPGPDVERLLDGTPEALAAALGSDREAAIQRDCHLLLRASLGARSRPTLSAGFHARLERRLAARRTVAPRRLRTRAARLLLGLYWLATAVASVLLLAPRIDLLSAGSRALEALGRLAPRLVPGSVSDLALAQVAVLASLLAVFAPSVLGAAWRRLVRPIFT